MIRLMNGNRAGFNSQIRLHFDSLTYNFVARFSENQYLNMTDIAWGKKGVFPVVASLHPKINDG